MNKREAFELLEDVEEDLQPEMKARTHQLGNGTWAVILEWGKSDKHKNTYFLWSVNDWWQYQDPQSVQETAAVS